MIDLYHPAPLLTLFDAFCAATGVSDATLSTRLFNDGKKIAALRGGASLTLVSAGRALDWFAAHWPDGTAWPVDVPRPGTSALVVVLLDRPEIPSPASSPGEPRPAFSPAASPAGVGDTSPAGDPLLQPDEVT